MGVSGFADELRALGFSEKVVGEVLQGLADLYISPRTPYSYVVKYTSGGVVRRTKYWPYSEVVKTILLQYGYADTSSKYAVYGPHANWHFIALTEKGLPLAREAYKRRLEVNLDFIKRHVEKYRSLAPLLCLGAFYDGTMGRAFFYSKPVHEVVSPYTERVIDAKVGWAPAPPIKQRTYHTAVGLWGRLRGVHGGERLDVVSAAFQSAATTESVVGMLNEFFSPLHERRLVLLMPDFNTKNVFTDRERWIVTNEILEIVKEEAVKVDLGRLGEFVKEFAAVLLLFLGGERRYTKGQVLKAAEAIASGSEGLGLSYDELLEGFRALVEEVSSTTGCTSKFNEPGGPDSPPFLVFSWEALRSAVREHLELLGSKALSLI